MKVLVTGGAGYIGSVATARLLDGGHDVTVFDNLELGHIEAVDARAQFVRGDLRTRESIRNAVRAAQPDAVMHFAAYALVGESMEDPGRYYANNITGGINLVDAMLETGVRRLVFSSSCATYGDPGGAIIDESMPTNPTNPYGHSKRVLETLLEWYGRRRDFSWVALRYFNACGATELLGEDHTPETHLIPCVLDVAQGHRSEVVVHGADYATPDGTCVRDYVHVADLAAAHELALSTGAEGVLNLGIGEGFSVREVITAAERVTQRRIPVSLGPRRPGDPDRLVANPSRARECLGWRPRYEALDDMIASAWRWRSAHPGGYAGSER